MFSLKSNKAFFNYYKSIYINNNREQNRTDQNEWQRNSSEDEGLLLTFNSLIFFIFNHIVKHSYVHKFMLLSMLPVSVY